MQTTSPITTVDIIIGVNSLIGGYNFPFLNFLLSHIDVSTMSDIHLNTLARSVYPMRTVLPDWDKFIHKTNIELAKRGILTLPEE